jgi:hypothetical protein
MSRYAKLTAGLIAVWFVFSVGGSALHLYQTAPQAPPLPVGLAVLTPIVLFLAWFRLSSGFREFTLSLRPRALTLVQSLRVVGFVFLILAARGALPRVFALPAGWGDIAIGVTAPFVAWRLATAPHRQSFLVWQALGIADLLVAVSLGTLASVIDPQGVGPAAMTVLPMSLIPTFAVPLFLILHLICMAQAVRWPIQRVGPMAPQHSPAAL